MISLFLIALLVASSRCVEEVPTSLRHETAQLRVSQSAIDYINSEIRSAIPVIQSELQNFPLPEVKGNNFRLHSLKLKSSRIGQSTVQFQNNGLRLRLFNNDFTVGGKFWVHNIIGIAGNIEVTTRNFGLDATLNFHYNNVKSVSMQSCNVNIPDLKINLYNPFLNLFLDIMAGAIRNMAQGMLCDALQNSGIPAINKAIAAMPQWYDIGNTAKVHFRPGYASVDSSQLTTAYFAAVQPKSGNIDWKFSEKSLPRSGHSGQCCIWVSDYLLNTVLGTFMPAGSLSTTIDAADYSPGGIAAPLTAEVRNTGAPLLSLTPAKIYLSAGVDMSLKGEDSVNLGKYSNEIYLESDTDITMRQLLEAFRQTTKLDIESAALDLLKREVCQDDQRVAQHCVYWARVGECKKNPNYMLYHCKKSCGVCKDEGNDAVDAKVNAVEYLLNHVSPSKDYVQFYQATSEVLNGSVRYCGKFRPTQKTRDMVHRAIRDYLRSHRR